MVFHQISETLNPGGFTRPTYQPYTITEAGPVAPNVMPDRLVVICNKPGEFAAVEGTVTLKLRNHSVSFGFYLYYFVGDRYQSLLVGD